MKKIFALLALLVLPFSAAQAQDQSWPTHQTLFVNDYAGIIDEDAETRITRQLEVLREETGVEATVLTLNTRRGYTPTATMEDFATGLFNAWGIGDASKNDGILVLVLRDDREMRVELGSGYGTAFNREAQDIIDRIFLPQFRADNYSYGIEAGTDAVIERIARVHWNGEKPSAFNPDNMFAYIALALFGLVTGIAMFARRIGDRFMRCPECGQRGLDVARNVIRTATRNSAGQGNRIIDCPSCGYHSVRPYTIPRRSSSSSGGFGGGSSSGGGASGRW